MEQGLLSGVLTLSLVLLNPSSAASAPTTSQVATSEMRDYAVKKGDTLSQIAEKEYGSINYWTNLWNDNPWIEDPNLIEKDWKLKLRRTNPEESATLSAELEEKLKNKQQIVQPLPKIQPVSGSTQAQAQQTIASAGTNYAGGPLNEAQITYLGNCESGMRPATNTGNGFYGAFQFTIGTWNAMGTGFERADLAPLEVQMGAVQKLLSKSSIYTQFPGCAAKMRNIGLL